MPTKSKKNKSSSSRTGNSNKPSSSKASNNKASSSYVSSKSKPEVKKRSTLMTIALVVIVLHSLIAAYLYSTLSADPSVSRPWLISMAVVHFLANVVAAYGIFKWKKWGLHLYAYSAVVGMVTGALAVGIWSMFYLILPLIIMGYIFRSHYDQFE
jgi:lipoprotein signal peptidase